MANNWVLLQVVDDREPGVISCPTCGSHRWIVDCDRDRRYFLICATPYCDEVFPIPEHISIRPGYERRNVGHLRRA